MTVAYFQGLFLYSPGTTATNLEAQSYETVRRPKFEMKTSAASRVEYRGRGDKAAVGFCPSLLRYWDRTDCKNVYTPEV
jgi:hypothetical protein